MHIVIVGAGAVGGYLARILVEEGHEVAVVELDRDLAQSLDKSLNALVVQGSGASPAVLKQAGVEKADILLAVTAVDEVNLIACMAARRCGKPGLRVVARVRQAHYLNGDRTMGAETLGLDAMVSPEESIASVADDILRYSGEGEMRELAGGRLALVGMVLSADSPLAHQTLAELRDDLPKDLAVLAVQGSEGVRIPTGADRLKEDERAFVLTLPRNLTELAILSGRPWHPVRRVLLIGCGNTGLAVARELIKQDFKVTVIEKDPARAEAAAGLLETALVLGGDGSDPEFLKKRIEEGRIDAVLVLLKETEKAVLIGIFAKSLGAGKVIARCDKPALGRLAQGLGIDAFISQKHAMANAILRYTRPGKVRSTLFLGQREAELVEFKVPPRPSRPELVERPIKRLDLPPDAVIGAVIRADTVYVATGDVVLRPGDAVFVACRRESLERVENLFDPAA